MAAAALAVAFATGNTFADQTAFDAHWRDGQAELNGYRLQIDRYGETRIGHAVLIYVTEPFSESKRVKLDNPSRHPSDTIDAIKLNLVRDFQTGIYDYNTMVSVFSRTSDFSPVKISFSSAEWCGHVYEELTFHPGQVRGFYASYFEGETANVALDAPSNGVTEDNLWILLRGLGGDFLKPGGQRDIPYLPGLLHGRFAHRPPAWTTAIITRAEKPQSVTVPAGTFDVTAYTVTVAGGRTGRFFIETTYPHRVIRWELSPDVNAELTGSIRSAYWLKNKNGDEQLLEKIGIPPPTHKTSPGSINRR
jgi:hypothetical protein